MAYYIISHDPESMGQFQGRFNFLKNANWVTEIEVLKPLLASGERSYFFITLSHFNPDIDNTVLWIKGHTKNSKLIYVYDPMKTENFDLHKNSPFGGDLYIDMNLDEEAFYEQLKTIGLTDPDRLRNKLDQTLSGMVKIVDEKDLISFKKHPLSEELDKYFTKYQNFQPATLEEMASFNTPSLGEDMSDKDQELSLDNLEELEISDDTPPLAPIEEEGLELSIDANEALDLTDEAPSTITEDEGFELDSQGEIPDMSVSEDLALNLEEAEDEEEVSLSEDTSSDLSDIELSDESQDLSLTADENLSDELNLSTDSSTSSEELEDLFTQSSEDDFNLDSSSFESELENVDELSLSEDELDLVEEDLSEDALEKLKEIDEIMVSDASQASMRYKPGDLDDADESFSLENNQELQADIDQPLVSDDLNLDGIDFPVEEPIVRAEEKENKKKKAKEVREEKLPEMTSPNPSGRIMGQELKEISGAYSIEMERLQATISNLRQDREELLTKIQKIEEEKMLFSRQNLSLRAELDEKKIELTIVRKKLNEDISELKDRLRIQDEKKLIQEERFKQLKSELDKVDQKNKLDLRKVQMRERELEQKLELLKSDAETQIRNRDLKILELKRKIDTMEFDMESISTQEKRSVESRFELEDKLDKAIKTLRSAISVLEEESDQNSALEALKKNIEM
jgi:hypothetical protein